MAARPDAAERMSRRASLPLSPWSPTPGEIEAPKPYRPVRVETEGGPLACRHYPAAGSTLAGMVWVGGVGGGWDSPARGMYPRLAEELARVGVASLRVRFRDPLDLHGCVHDVLAGLAFLADQGVEALGVCGHSAGGAVAVQAAADAPQVRVAVALAPQVHGADATARLGPRCALLLVHGTGDRVLPDACSRHLHRIAGEPKRLVLLPGAGHVLDEAAGEVAAEVRAWILERLLPPRA